MKNAILRLAGLALLGAVALTGAPAAEQVVSLRGDAGGKRFDGIGFVNGGGATAVLLKDYPEPQRSQILDLVYKPMFGASVSALLVEIPGDGNSTQGSMPSHMHTRDDLDYTRGYMWWILREAKKRNPGLTLDGAAWSAPGWIGEDPAGRFSGENGGDPAFWSRDAVDYCVKWLQGLRGVYGLEFDAIGCRNEKGLSYGFVKAFRKGLDENGFAAVQVHAFDHWPKWKFDFVKDLLADAELRNSIDILGAHVMYANEPASAEVQAMAARMGKPIWNTEDHVYLRGFECAISLVECFNENFIVSGATKVVNWYDIGAVYPIEPYPEDPPVVLAPSPWSGHYRVREALWGYAHYGQFTQAGWVYLNGGSGRLAAGGTFVTLKSPENDYSVIIETKGSPGPQRLRLETGGGLSARELCVWRSNSQDQFVRQADLRPAGGAFTITLEPDAIYSLSTTTGQQKGSFAGIPAAECFPFPYRETFEDYAPPAAHGHLPRYTADIAGAFEITGRPDRSGRALRQVMPRPPISWAPDWQPYTIIGDAEWRDYEVSADVWLNPGDTAAVMGRVNHVGTGYGFIPQGYFAQLGADGLCRLVVVRGKPDKKKAVGDAEQQRLIAAAKDDGEGGEKELGRIQLPGVGADRWHNLKIRFEGATITALVDDRPVLTAKNELYGHGMAGLLAGQDKTRTSTPWFDNLVIKAVNAPLPPPSVPAAGQTPIYDPFAGHPGRVAHELITVEAPFPMPALRVPVFPARDFPITDFGAKEGGEAPSTDALRRAIAACHAAGGGRVVVPAGTWLTGAVHLRSNVNLHLAKDAVLSFSDNPEDYLPAVQSSWEGWECFNYSPLIYAFGQENVAITGAGKIQPRMGTWRKWFARPPAHMAALKQLYAMGSTGVPVAERQMAVGEANLRPQLIQFNRCRNVLLEDVTIRDSPFWTIHLLQCDDVVVRRLDVSAHGHNNDGLNPEGTRNLLVEDCRFDQGDDAIAIKSGTNHDGWRLGRPSENIVMRRCTVTNGHQLVAIGSELSGGVRNVYVHDCRFAPPAVAAPTQPFNVLYLKTNRRRGGFVENITVENIDAARVKFKMGVFGIETDVLYQWRTLVPAYEERLTSIRGITLRNVTAGETATPFRILGDRDQPVRDVVIENITIGTVRGQRNRYENAENVKESGVKIGTFVEEPDRENSNR
jgi:galactosylceramidase